MRRHITGLIAGLASLTAFGGAQAATTTGTFNVKITIITNCVVSATDMLFPVTTGVLNANIDQTSVISVTCTNTTPYTVGIEVGTNGGGTVLTRKMIGGPSNELISYALFSDSLRTANWGNTAGTGWQTGTGNGNTTPQTYTVYGRVAAQNTPTPGNYTDVVQVTVTY